MKTAHCHIPGTPVSPLPLCGHRAHLPTNTLTEHLADKSDPHNVRALVPAMRIGTGAPSVETGDKETDFYFDSEESTLYVLRDVGEGILRWESIARVTITQLTNKISELETTKANKATTLAGYGITDAATKEEVEAKADNTALESEIARAQAAESQLTDKISELDSAKADKANTLAGYGITDAATKEEIKAKADKADIEKHVTNTNNPHAVTVKQIGAVPFVEDSNGNKTAVTIGRRLDDNPVGEYSFANGNYAAAPGPHAHAEGETTKASAYCSHADGNSAETRKEDDYAYAWNGDTSKSMFNPYFSHGKGTFNINPNGGLDGLYIGEKTLAAILAAAIANKADRASLALEYSPSAAYPVGSIVYYYGNIYQCKTAIAEGGEAWTAAHWELRKLSDFFTNSNSLLTGTIDARLPYPLYAVPSTGLLKDRAINTTSLASVTVPENFTDLLVRASVASSLSVTMPGAIATKYGDTFPGEAGEYLITITKTGAAEAYVRTIKLEVANA